MPSSTSRILKFIVAMVSSLLLAVAAVQPAQAVATSATISWVNTLAGTGNGEIYATTTDANGNVYVSGYFEGTYASHNPSITSISVGDFYIAKFDSTGTEIWMKNFGATVGAGVKDIVVDSSGNVFGTGWYCGTATIGALGAIAATGNCDGFLLKLSSSGTPVWFKHWGQSANWDGSDGLGLDSSGNLYVAAYIGRVNLEGATGIDGVTWNAAFAGANDGTVVIKFNSSGVAQYATALPSNFYHDGYGHPFVVSADGKVLLGGYFSGSANFGSAGSFTTPDAASDAALVELTSSGAISFVKVFTGANDQTIRGVAYDVAGSIYVQGLYKGSTTVGGVALTSAGSTDTFVAKFNSSAQTLTWLTNWGSANDDDLEGLAVDAAGNVVTAGGFKGSVTLGALGTFTSSGGNDGIAVGLNSDGSFGWAKKVSGTSDNEIAWAKPSVVAGAAYVGGRYASNANFGDGFTALFTTAANTVDGFFEKISITWANTTPLTPASNSNSVQNSAPAVASVFPQVSAITPRVLETAKESQVVVKGSNLDKVTAIFLGDSKQAFKLLTNGDLQLLLPPHVVGAVTLKLVTANGSLPIENAVRYSDVLNTHLAVITLVNPTSAALATAKAKFAKITYEDRVVTKGKKPRVTVTLTGRIKN